MLSRATEANSNHVKSILKAFLIMEELDKAGELSIGDLSERLSMDKATIHRLVNTIKDAGYVNQNADNKKYSNNLKLLAMGIKVMERVAIKQISYPYMKILSEQSRETVDLGIFIDNQIIYIDRIEPSFTMKAGPGIGSSLPVCCTALGKAILAFLPVKEMKEVLKKITLEKYTENTLVEQQLLEQSLQTIRKLGYSVDNEEYTEGLICFGAPIINYHGIPVAAIGISCPKYRYNERKHFKQFSELVIDAAKNISKQLDYKNVW